MLCPHCQTPVDPSGHSCARCGKTIEPPQQLPASKRNFLWFTVLGLVIAATLLFAGVVWVVTQHYEDVIEKQLEAIHDNRIIEAYYSYTTKEFQANTSFEAFKSFVKNHPELARMKELTIIDKEASGPAAYVTGLMTFSDGQEKLVEYNLVKEDNDWKIEGFAFSSAESHLSPLEDIDHEDVHHQEEQQDDSDDPYYMVSSNPPEDREKQFDSVEEEIALSPANPETAVHTVSPAPAEAPAAPGEKPIVPMETTAAPTPAQPVSAPAAEPPALTATPPATPETPAAAVPENTAKPSEEFNSDELFDLVQQQLRALRQNDMIKAYSSTYTTKGFRGETSLKDFEDYMRKHLVFSQYRTVEFNKVSLKNGVATLGITLIVSESEKTPVTYTFIKDDGQWKIQHILIPLPEAAEEKKEVEQAAGPMEFTKAVFGATVDPQGIIKDPELELKSTTPTIFINLYVKAGVSGTKIDLQLQHVDTGSRTAIVSTTLQKNGDMVLSIGYPPPVNGWLKGTYKLMVNSSTGLKHTFLFIIQ